VTDSTIAPRTIEGFLDTLASDDPTPGGGAVAAVCGAAGASSRWSAG
jgi:formiminotetrahydrofolate cyclodeaminase